MLPAMILCAGFGTRLRPLTHQFPKPLLPVGDQPAFAHIVDQLTSGGFGPLALNTHHRADAFEGTVPQGVSVLHESTILGTAGGVANAAEALGQGDVLVWNGDIQVSPNLSAMLQEHREAATRAGAVATLLAAPSDGAGTIGVDASGYVSRLRGEAFGVCDQDADYLGVMILSEAARRSLPKEGCLVGDVLMPMLRKGAKVRVAFHDSDWVDIGTPASYLDANLRWLRARGLASWVAPGAVVPASVELEDSVVSAGGRIEGSGAVTRCIVLPGGRLEAPARQCIAMEGEVLRLSGR